jgi:hypothetical protein
MSRIPPFLIVSALAVSGCGRPAPTEVVLEQRQLTQPNLTRYEFNATLNEVKAAIEAARGKDWNAREAERRSHNVWKGWGGPAAQHAFTVALQLPPADLLWKGDGDALARGLLLKPENKNDAYLFGADTPTGLSTVYSKGGYPLIYYASFHIHLAAGDGRKVRVEISTYDPRVVAGLDDRFSAHGPSFIFVRVEPTTVEEYQILRAIGEQLGVKDMPPVETPSTNSPLKQITRPRRT